MAQRVLFVCLGNICRSPLAEGVLRRHMQDAGLDLTVDSAATGGWHEGNPPDARAIVAAREHGFDISKTVARRVRSEDYTDFDLILAMDDDNLSELLRRAPSQCSARIDKLTSFCADGVRRDIPDPYYTGKFDPVIAQIEQAVVGLLPYLKAEQDRSADDANTL